MKIFLFVGLFVVSCAIPKKMPGARAIYSGVVVRDGVSKVEAELICKHYFARFVGCGGFDMVTDERNRWQVHGAAGYAAAPIKGFYIDKSSGKITSTIGPSFEGP